MNENNKTKTDDKARERALQLVRHLADENVDPQLHAQLLDWFGGLREGGVGEQAFAEFAAGSVQPNLNPDDREFEQYSELRRRLDLYGGKRRRESISLTRRRSFRILAGATAAAVILAGMLVLPGLWSRLRTDGIAQVSITAQPGSEKEITLPDGSTVKLKGATTIAYAENFAANRRISIDGEAYFIVTRDEEHPFTVEGDNVTVTVLGTEFNMKAHESDAYAEVILTKGTIEVASGGASVTLSPSDKAMVDKNRHEIDLGEANRREIMNLMGFEVDFDDTLGRIFETLARYYGKKVTIDAAVDCGRNVVMPFDGTESGERVLETLRLITGNLFSYKIEGDTIIIAEP